MVYPKNRPNQRYDYWLIVVLKLISFNNYKSASGQFQINSVNGAMLITSSHTIKNFFSSTYDCM